MSRTYTILSCSPLFTDAALNELRRAHSVNSAAADITLRHLLAPGLLLLTTSLPFRQLTLPWRNRLPIYLHHCFPVQRVLSLSGTPDDLTRLARAVKRLVSPAVTVQVRVVGNASDAPDVLDVPPAYTAADVQRAIHPAQQPYSRTTPNGRVLSVLIVRVAEGETKVYIGVSDARENLSPWAGGRPLIAEPVSNRAGYKLLEAISSFGIRLHRNSAALDLGAAPGAWTTLLRQHGLQVTAVAPTPLYPWLLVDSGVDVQPMLAEDYLHRCSTRYDLLVNDMKLDAQDSARLMVAYAAHLRAGGIALMTLKLRERNTQRVADHALRLLRRAYKIIRVRQLVYNKRELTLFLRRKD